mgnify:CR=1 FL=1
MRQTKKKALAKLYNKLIYFMKKIMNQDIKSFIKIRKISDDGILILGASETQLILIDF